MIMLMLAAMDGEDDKAFMLNLYKNYYGLVRKTIYSITNDLTNSEDLINGCFIKLIEKVSLLRTFDSSKTNTYVVYTARSVAINFIKHREVREKHTYFGVEEDLAEGIPALAENLEEKLVRQQEIDFLCNAILKFPEKQKNLLFFKYLLEMTDEEIAQNLSISPDSVRQYLTRARREAKKLMERGMSDYVEK
ncbi:MAG: sigma-70 family RNA polymerase sigma factor [Bacillota bacterium]|nr:sigma-70 family RNA polymerase sigma factor [Bacillota bacterium]